MKEEWKEIKEYEGRYMVSNFGRIQSVARCHEETKKCWAEKMMKLHVHTNCYQVVWLRKPGFHQKFYVHRIVAKHFLERPEGKDFVNHKDKNRMNNHVDNLEWCTHDENMKHRDAHRTPVCDDAIPF